MSKYFLPSKLPTYLRRLLLNYEHSGPSDLASILKHGRVAVDLDKARYYDFGTDHIGHDVVIFLPPATIAPISMAQQAKVTERLLEDIRECAKGFSGEYVNAVRLELDDPDEWLDQVAQSLTGKPATNPDKLTFWTPGQIRLFISHRDNYKREAKTLAEALSAFGICCFVAHDTIEPMESWQHQIEMGLETMEVFLALVTDDFHDSVWTNQEVGFAKARNVPVISLKLGATPEGFIANKQAIPGDKDYLARSADEIYLLLAEKLGLRERLQSSVISAFAAAPNWNEAKWRFDRMDALVKVLSDDEFQEIKNAFESNDQLFNAIHLRSRDRLVKFLARTTGKQFKLDKGKIVPAFQEQVDEIPF